jgi:hypothetical protein
VGYWLQTKLVAAAGLACLLLYGMARPAVIFIIKKGEILRRTEKGSRMAIK